MKKCLLPYITANITYTPTQHGDKAQHSTVTALHTLNNTVAKGFNQMAPPARTITAALDMRKAFDTVNTHTLIEKLLHTSNPGTVIKIVVKYLDAKPILILETKNPYNVRLKLAFLKAITENTESGGAHFDKNSSM